MIRQTKLRLTILALLTAFIVFNGTATFAAQQDHPSTINESVQENKYPINVMFALRESLGVNKFSEELDHEINIMPKVEVMDRHLLSLGEELDSFETRESVQAIFNINLDYISENNFGSKLNKYNEEVMMNVRASLGIDPQSTELDILIMDMPKNEIMDRYFINKHNKVSSQEARNVINYIYGVNLNGISSIEYARLSIFSKGQWVIHNDTNIFIVSSSNDDTELYVAPTQYYKEKTGNEQLPDSLISDLVSIGFVYDSTLETYIYRSLNNESVPDSVKGQVMGTVVQTINTHYIDL